MRKLQPVMPVLHLNDPDYDPPEPYPWQAHSAVRAECGHCGRFALVDDNDICEICYEENEELQQYPEED
jgi:hypothetical protein